MILAECDRLEFLLQSGWDGSCISSVGEDWSQRKFFRVERNGQKAILMHAVPDHDARSTLGHKLCDFVSISEYLRSIEFSAPVIYNQDLEKGLLLVEDFGHWDFSSFIRQQDPRVPDLYKVATDCLLALYHKTDHVKVSLPSYTQSHIHKGRQRVVDWYIPAVLCRKNDDGLVDEYLSVWQTIEQSLPRPFCRFQHGDFHPGNLMYLPDRMGIRQVGLIDFQGAMVGPAPYDLVNLLEDARRFVPVGIKDHCLSVFLGGLKAEECESFESWYPVLATQFHCRIIGQAIKLAVKNQKNGLLDLLPLLRCYLSRDLSHPVLAPLKSWFDEQKINFLETDSLHPLKIADFIREDAF